MRKTTCPSSQRGFFFPNVSLVYSANALSAQDNRQFSLALRKVFYVQSIEQKIGQMLAVGFHGLEAPDYILEWLRAGRIGGVILFSRNIASPQQVAELTAGLRDAAPHPILIAIDQEGGVVARLRSNQGFLESPGAMALGAADDPALAEEVSAALGAELTALGINWNLAPVVDLLRDYQNPSVGARSLGTDKMRVAELAAAEVRGFQNGGVAATAKHFPGLGHTAVDTHLALAVISDSAEELRAGELVPFRAAVTEGVAAVMVSLVMFEQIDPKYPSTLSPKVIRGLLRNELGFTGVACTDCMEMKAIADHYGAGESAVLAALAGDDLIFFSHTRQMQENAYDTLLSAARSGRLPVEPIDAANERLTALKSRFPARKPDISQVRKPERIALMERAARASTVLVRDTANLLPLNDQAGRVGVVEFASWLDSGVMEAGGISGFARLLWEASPTIESVSLMAENYADEAVARARTLAAEGDVLVLATRNAHLISEQRQLAQELVRRAKQTVLVALRNPFDIGLFPDVPTVLCTCGDSAPSLAAAVDGLLGKFKPTARLPFPLEQTV
jgi:beta-N-acetylhexosaminidase